MTPVRPFALQKSARLSRAERFADFSQWEIWLRSQRAAGKSILANDGKSGGESASGTKDKGKKKKLSYLETREIETIEQRIADAEKELQTKHDSMLDPVVMSDSARLHALSLELEAAQEAIDELYTRWGELEKKQA